MSLSVYARRRDADGNSVQLAPTPPRNDLAGFEAWRQEVWGSPAVKRLGLRILPSLADGDVFASGAELDALDAEVRALQHALSAVIGELWPHADPQDAYDSLRFRLDNIAEAVRLARAVPDGEVVIS